MFRAVGILKERLEKSEDAYKMAKDILAFSPNDDDGPATMEIINQLRDGDLD